MIYKNQVKEKRAFKDAYRIMKKIGAFLLSLVMLLSVIVLPTNTTQAAEAMPTVSYSVHAQSYGWMNPAQNGKTAVESCDKTEEEAKQLIQKYW